MSLSSACLSCKICIPQSVIETGGFVPKTFVDGDLSADWLVIYSSKNFDADRIDKIFDGMPYAVTKSYRCEIVEDIQQAISKCTPYTRAMLFAFKYFFVCDEDAAKQIGYEFNGGTAKSVPIGILLFDDLGVKLPNIRKIVDEISITGVPKTLRKAVING
jgi:hypothetical protein